jgi:glycine C-acetyltransferase
MGHNGGGTGFEQNCQDDIDVYFGTFAKSFALTGGFISSDEQVIEYMRYNMRSQIFAKSMPMPLVVGALKRLELMRKHPEYREKLWEITRALQNGLVKAGFEIGVTNSPVTPVYMNGSIPEATNLIIDLRENFDIFCSMVVYPVVPKGMIILRLIPTAVHTLDDVNYTIDAFSKIVHKLKSGQYMADKIASV